MKYIYISLLTDNILERDEYYIYQLIWLNKIATFSSDTNQNAYLIPSLYFQIPQDKVEPRLRSYSFIPTSALIYKTLGETKAASFL
uniref:Uncharacterized protein n=1 Tax=Octopus bimaculoides TaxID=37653 RepID=A0A0L8FWT3_OCTBM